MEESTEQEKPDRVEPFSLPRPQRRVFTQTFRDPLHPSKHVQLSLRFQEDYDRAKAAETVEDLCRRFVPPEGSNQPLEEFPPVGGRPVLLTRSAVEEAALVFTMQAEDGKITPYRPEELIALRVTMPLLWQKVIDFCVGINRDREYLFEKSERHADLNEIPAVRELDPGVIGRVSRKRDQTEEESRGRTTRNRRKQCPHRVRGLSTKCIDCKRTIPASELPRLWLPLFARPLIIIVLLLAVAFAIVRMRDDQGSTGTHSSRK